MGPVSGSIGDNCGFATIDINDDACASRSFADNDGGKAGVPPLTDLLATDGDTTNTLNIETAGQNDGRKKEKEREKQDGFFDHN